MKILSLFVLITLTLICSQCKTTEPAVPPSPIGFGSRGDGATRLTQSVPLSSQNPVFSPDGSKILFTRFKAGYNLGRAELVIMDADGTHERIVFSDPDATFVNAPFGSWVGHQICFSSERGAEAEEIYTSQDDGTGLKQVTTHTIALGRYTEPVFNPQNGMELVFEVAPQDSGDHRIALLELDKGGAVTFLTDGSANDAQPSWSNDGRRIVFQRLPLGKKEGWSIIIADIELGTAPVLTNIRTLFPLSGDNTDITWTPADSLLLCSSNFGHLASPNLFLFPASGGGVPTRLTRCDTCSDGAASMSPDSKRVVFESRRAETEATPSDVWLLQR
jgi:TolB protein